MGVLHVVGIKSAGKLDGFHNRIMGFPKMTEDEVGLRDDTGSCRHINDMRNLLLRDVLAHRVQNPLAARLHPELNGMATSLLHQFQDVQVGDKVHPRAA